MRIIRVDEAVYRKILSRKHSLESAMDKSISMNTALKSLLTQPEKIERGTE